MKPPKIQPISLNKVRYEVGIHMTYDQQNM